MTSREMTGSPDQEASTREGVHNGNAHDVEQFKSRNEGSKCMFVTMRATSGKLYLEEPPHEGVHDGDAHNVAG